MQYAVGSLLKRLLSASFTSQLLMKRLEIYGILHIRLCRSIHHIRKLAVHLHVRPIIALSSTARRQEETAPKINHWRLVSTSQTVFVLMEPHTATRTAGISKSKMLLVSVKICVVHEEEKSLGRLSKEFMSDTANCFTAAQSLRRSGPAI